MPAPLVYLARHSRTEWNDEGRRQGQLDSPLTPEGVAHAEALARTAAGRGIDAIFSSPLGRALTTAETVSAACGIPVVVLDELAEVHHGDLAGRTDAETERTHPGLLAERARDLYTWRFPAGESYADAHVRARRALERVASTAATAPLIVAHEMIGRMLRAELLHLEPADALRLRHAHDQLLELDPAARTERAIQTA